MAGVTLIPDPTQIELVRLSATANEITVVVRTHTTSSRCPVCGAPTTRVHSRYTRQVADLPWLEIAVRLQLQVRRFFCDQLACPRAIFTERLSGVVAPYARRTLRLTRLVELVGFLLGGSAGSRLLRQVVSSTVAPRRDTILRTMRRAVLPTPPLVETLSVDDFAFRRGQTYGTLLLDLERRQVVDLLPERSDVAFAHWLRTHPGVRIISRDRGGDYAAGAALGAPPWARHRRNRSPTAFTCWSMPVRLWNAVSLATMPASVRRRAAWFQRMRSNGPPSTPRENNGARRSAVPRDSDALSR